MIGYIWRADLTASDLVTWPRRAETARERWAQLGISAEIRRGLRILDAACGCGVDSFVLAQADPSARVTALDLPKVLAIAAQVAAHMGVREQVTFCPGNLLEVDLPAGEFDVVLFGAILYYFSPDNVTAVLRKAWHALVPGGLVVIRTIIADEERCQDEMALLMAVELLHDAAQGKVYTFSEYNAFLAADAGCRKRVCRIQGKETWLTTEQNMPSTSLSAMCCAGHSRSGEGGLPDCLGHGRQGGSPRGRKEGASNREISTLFNQVDAIPSN